MFVCLFTYLFTQVNEIGDLWDEREYDEEFKVNQFLKKLKN